MVSGTIRYTEQDFALSQTVISPARTIPLWQGTCAIACLGAIIGYGSVTLLSEALAQALPVLAQYTAWGAGDNRATSGSPHLRVVRMTNESGMCFGRNLSLAGKS